MDGVGQSFHENFRVGVRSELKMGYEAGLYREMLTSYPHISIPPHRMP